MRTPRPQYTTYIVMKAVHVVLLAALPSYILFDFVEAGLWMNQGRSTACNKVAAAGTHSNDTEI